MNSREAWAIYSEFQASLGYNVRETLFPLVTENKERKKKEKKGKEGREGGWKERGKEEKRKQKTSF